MDTDGTASLDSIVVGLKALLEDLNKREAEAQAALTEVTTERKRIAQMIRAAEGSGIYGKHTTKKENLHSLNAETLEAYYQRLKTISFDAYDDLPGAFSVKDIQTKLGIHNSTAQRIARGLRDDGRTRLVGQRYNEKLNPTHTGKAHPVYVFTD